MADLSQSLADFGQLDASLAIPENTGFCVRRAVHPPPGDLRAAGIAGRMAVVGRSAINEGITQGLVSQLIKPPIDPTEQEPKVVPRIVLCVVQPFRGTKPRKPRLCERSKKKQGSVAGSYSIAENQEADAWRLSFPRCLPKAQAKKTNGHSPVTSGRSMMNVG